MTEFVDINGSFEKPWQHGAETGTVDGWHSVAGGGTIQQIKIPGPGQRPWFVRWADESIPNPFYDGNTCNLFARPEIDLKEEWQLPENEQKDGSDPLILDGNWTLKIFKGGRAYQCELLTTIDAPGRYKFTRKVRPDPVLSTEGGKKVYATDRATFVYSVVGSQRGTIQDITPTDDSVAEWQTSAISFDATAGMVFGLGFLAPWGLQKGTNFFCDGWTLEKIDDEPVAECEAPARAKYARLYVCLPSDVPNSWAQAASRVCHERDKWTLGYSPDDAGATCGLESKRVLAVNPQNIGTGLTQAWFDEYYAGGPGVVMYTILATSAADLETKLRNWTPVTPPPPPPTPPPSPPSKVIKAAFHNQLPWSGQFDLLKRAHDAGKPFAVVKVLASDMEQIITGRPVTPSTLWIYREVNPFNPDELMYAADPYAYLDNSHFATKVDRAVELGYDIMETPINEVIGTHNPEVVKANVATDIVFLKWLDKRHQGKIRGGIITPGGGNPDHDAETANLVPAALAAIDYGAVLMPHTYFPVTLAATVSETWMKSLQVQYDYHLRPILSWLPTFADHGVDVDNLRCVFGEGSGCGANVNPEGLPGGYKDAGAGWRREDALNGNLQRNLNLLEWYEGLCQAYEQIVGWCIFTSGRVGWKHFQFNEGEWPLLVDRLLP